MNLLAVNLSAHPSDIHKFLQKLQMLSWSRGDQPQVQDVLRRWHRFAISRNDLLAFLILAFLHDMYRSDCIVGYMQQGVSDLVRLQLKAI